jgi:hypothetical protein
MFGLAGKILRFALVVMIGMLGALPPETMAEDNIIGSLRKVAGSAEIIRQGQSLPARDNQQLMRGDVLRTGADGSMGVILRDDTVLSLGPKSELAMDEFDFSPVEDKLSLVGKMTKGTATFLTGKIGQMRPEAVRVETPNGTIGVRGTQFLVQVGEQ